MRIDDAAHLHNQPSNRRAQTPCEAFALVTRESALQNRNGEYFDELVTGYQESAIQGRKALNAMKDMEKADDNWIIGTDNNRKAKLLLALFGVRAKSGSSPQAADDRDMFKRVKSTRKQRRVGYAANIISEVLQDKVNDNEGSGQPPNPLFCGNEYWRYYGPRKTSPDPRDRKQRVKDAHPGTSDGVDLPIIHQECFSVRSLISHRLHQRRLVRRFINVGAKRIKDRKAQQARLVHHRQIGSSFQIL